MSDVKRYLGQVRYIDQRIESKIRELDNLRKNIPSASNWKVDNVQESNRNRSFVDRLVALDGEITNEVDRLVDIRRKISREMSALKTSEAEIILRERYINLRSFSDIANFLCLSERHVKRLHGQALVEFETIYRKEIDKFIK